MRPEKTFDQDGFVVSIYHVDDNDPYLSYLGEYTDRAPRDAPYYDRAFGRVVDPKAVCAACEGSGNGPADDDGEPTDCAACDATGEPTTVEEREEAERWDHRREYRYIFGGFGDPAYLAQDAKRLEAYNAGEWCCIGIRATACKEGVILGESDVFGVDSDGGQEYFDEMTADVVAEAIDVAKETLAKLQVRS